MRMVKVNIDRNRDTEVKEIFDFINRVDSKKVEKVKTFDECLEDAELDIRLQHDYIIELLEQTESSQDYTFKKIQECLVDRELANALEDIDDLIVIDETIERLDERLDEYNDKYSILLDMLSSIQDEVMR